MRIAVVIPCLNAASYLAQTIGSVLDQTRPADEIILVDDGSTDGSLDLAQRLAARLPGRMQVVQGRAGSATRARNLGAELAAGDALMFLDADDVLGPDALEGLDEALTRRAGGVALCPWFRLSLRDGRWITGPPTCVPRRPDQDALDAWLTGWYHPPCSVLWSREAFERAGRWDEQTLVNQDGDLMMRALVHGVPLVHAARGAAYYRRAPAGSASLSSTARTRRGLEGRMRVIRKVAFLLESQRSVRPYRRAIAAALAQLAEEARPVDPDLASRAAALARQYRLSVFRRAIARARGPLAAARVRLLPPRRLAPGTTTAEPESGSGTELRCGLDRAARLIASEPDGPEGDAQTAQRSATTSAGDSTVSRS